MPLHTHTPAQPLSPPPSKVCSDVFMCTEYIKEKKILHPLQNRHSALPCATLAAFFRVVWLPLLWEAELINVWSRETLFFFFFALLISFYRTCCSLHIKLFQKKSERLQYFILFEYLAFHYDLIHLFKERCSPTSWYHLWLLCPFKQLKSLIIVVPRRASLV